MIFNNLEDSTISLQIILSSYRCHALAQFGPARPQGGLADPLQRADHWGKMEDYSDSPAHVRPRPP